LLACGDGKWEGRARAVGTFEEKLRRVSERNVRAGIVHTSYSSFAIVAGKDLREGRQLWLVLPRGPAKLQDQERMMVRRPRPDLARSWCAFAFCYWAWSGCNCKNVGACDCQCGCALRKPTFCPPVAAVGHVCIKSWRVIVMAGHVFFRLRVIFCIQAQHTILLLRSAEPWQGSARPLGHCQYLMLWPGTPPFMPLLTRKRQTFYDLEMKHEARRRCDLL
jgi:hypothetical protein